jgi:hypothetical protein
MNKGVWIYGGDVTKAFRFRDKIDGKWVYGGIAGSNALCRYIGFADQTGKDIFEGDILEYIDAEGLSHHFLVAWNNDLARFELRECLNQDCVFEIDEFCLECSRLDTKIIGNRFDNPELLPK